MRETSLIERWGRGIRTWKRTSDKQGSALIPALMVVSMLAMLGLSMLSAGMSGTRMVNGQTDEYRLTSAVESVGSLAVEKLWSGYLRQPTPAPGTTPTQAFRAYLNGLGIADAGPGGAPNAGAGQDLLAFAEVPGQAANAAEFDNVNVDALRVVRRDADDDSTTLYLTVSASTQRGQGLVTHPLNRAVQLVYTIEPPPFEGFDYGILTKNVNCVFCHTVVDSAERAYNHDPALAGSFAKVKVGTLESLMLRNDGRPAISDWDADSLIAGTLYVRGHATNQNGATINNWSTHTAQSCLFDNEGNLIQDSSGNLASNHFSPAGNPPEAGENLYLNYPTDYSQMPDGGLPTSFPPPFPDNGGIDPATGLPTSVGANNKLVDANEFYAAAHEAEGSIAGTINVSAPGQSFANSSDFMNALLNGNTGSITNSEQGNSIVTGNVILTGTLEHPLIIDGTVAIDGDVVISGYIQGKGTLLASGNVYIPTDLMYFDGVDADGHPTFGIAPDGTQNTLGLAAGGNVLIGDYLKPSLNASPEQFDIVTGSSDGAWNFALAEISLFNRTEWMHTQPTLPGPGTGHPPVANPAYIAGYLPKYYQFGPGDEIPIYNKGNLYFDPATGTWVGDAEVPLEWNPSQLTVLDPGNMTEPLLYDENGHAVATVLQISPENGWISDTLQKQAIEYFEDQHTIFTPMQIDGLLYTNNAIFGIVDKNDVAQGQLVVNGSLVCADLGVLAPGYKNPGGGAANVPGSPYAVGLRLNYDRRTKNMLNVTNPNQLTIKRTLWNPTANVL